jgi:hypothetical protein
MLQETIILRRFGFSSWYEDYDLPKFAIGVMCWRHGSGLFSEKSESTWPTSWLHVPEAHKIILYRSQTWFSSLGIKYWWIFKIMVYCHVRNKQAKMFLGNLLPLSSLLHITDDINVHLREKLNFYVGFRAEENIWKQDIQDRQCAYNVTFWRVRATTVAVKKQWVLHNLSVCIFSFRYPVYNAHAPYFHLLPAPLYKIFPHFLISGTIFEKCYWTQNVFWFSLQPLSETFLILRRNERDM